MIYSRQAILSLSEQSMMTWQSAASGLSAETVTAAGIGGPSERLVETFGRPSTDTLLENWTIGHESD